MSKHINDLKGKARDFAVACYDTNAIHELQAPHAPADADPADCREWEITPDEWSAAIEAALNERLSDGGEFSIGETIETTTTNLDGEPATQNGTVIDIIGDRVTVAWDDGERTTQSAGVLLSALAR